MRSVYAAGAVAVLVLTQTTFAHVTVAVFGPQSPVLDARAGDIGSGVFGLSCSEFSAVLAGIVLLAIRSTALRRIAAGALLIGIGYEVLTLAHHTVQIGGSVNGEPLGEIVNAHVTPAWGAWTMLVAAVAVTVAAWRGSSEEPDAGVSQTTP